MKFFRNPEFLSDFRAELHRAGLRSFRRDAAGEHCRLDANEVVFTARGLEYIYAQTYDVLYPAFQAKTLLPVNMSIPSGASNYTWFSYDKLGKAAFITNYANDFANAEVLMTENTGNIHSLGSGFSYSIQDLRRAASVQLGVGQPLDRLRAEATRFAHESKVDDVAAYGDSARNLSGMLTHPDIPTVSVINGAWSTTLATVDATNNGKIIADLNKLVNAVEQTTLGVEKPDTLVLPLSVKPRLTSPMDPAVFNAGSLIDHWFKQQTTIKSIEWWAKCDAAQSNGALTAGVALAMVYTRSPRVIELVIPQDFEMFEPERQGMSFRVACHSRIGGVVVHYPKACAYMNVGTGV